MKVNISKEAKEFILNHLSKKKANSVIVYFEGFGWGGPKFGIAVGEPNDKDVLVYDEEFKIYLDPIAQQWLSNLNIELRRGLFGKYLKINNGGGC